METSAGRLWLDCGSAKLITSAGSAARAVGLSDAEELCRVIAVEVKSGTQHILSARFDSLRADHAG